MNLFKKAYKEVNDSIPVNEELLNKLLVQAEKPVKTVKFKSIYKYSSVVAAALILAVSAIAIPNLLQTKKQPENIKSDIAVVTEKPEINKETQKKSTTDEPSKNVKATEDTAKTEDIAKTEDSAKTADIAKTVDTSYDAGDYAAAEQSAENSALAVANDYSVSSRAKTNTVSIDEYLQTFGFDLSSIILPDGVERLNHTAPVQYDGNGNPVLYEIVVAYSGSDKYLNITVTSNREFISEMLAKYPDNRVYGNDGYIGAYILTDNGGYSIDCYGFTENEVTALVSSLQ